MKQCTIVGCTRDAATYSRYCSFHRKKDRSHGGPEQTAVTKAELKPYIKAVQAYLSARSQADPSPIIKKAWDASVERSKSDIRAHERGQPHNRYHHSACKTIVDIDYNSDASAVAETLMAMGYWWVDHPKRFKSDDAFRTQAVRMLRHLAPMATQCVYGGDGRLIRSRYPEIGKTAVKCYWQLIKDMEFVGWGMAMAKEDQKTREVLRRDKIAERALILG